MEKSTNTQKNINLFGSKVVCGVNPVKYLCKETENCLIIKSMALAQCKYVLSLVILALTLIDKSDSAVGFAERYICSEARGDM